jgi:hypothetical protein
MTPIITPENELLAYKKTLAEVERECQRLRSISGSETKRRTRNKEAPRRQTNGAKGNSYNGNFYSYISSAGQVFPPSIFRCGFEQRDRARRIVRSDREPLDEGRLNADWLAVLIEVQPMPRV